MNTKVAQTHVWHEGACFFVSTINRESSSILGGTFAETLVWKWDEATRQRGDLIGQTGGSTDSIHAHQAMVKRLHETGKPESEDTDD